MPVTPTTYARRGAQKKSAKNPLNRPKSVVSVRRKVSEQKTVIGSVKMRDQQLAIRIITTQYLGSPHRLWKYKCEVLSPESEYRGNVDEIFSKVALRDGHSYEVLLNDSTENPRILELVCEIDPKKEGDE